jgi:hypothetical protein
MGKHKSVEDQLRSFIEVADARQWPRSTWIYSDTLDVYVRKGSHLLDTERTCLDIASIQVPESLWRQGIFSRFVMAAHEMHPWEATYIENAHNPIIRNWCEKHGWQRAGSRIDRDYSYYLLKG